MEAKKLETERLDLLKQNLRKFATSFQTAAADEYRDIAISGKSWLCRCRSQSRSRKRNPRLDPGAVAAVAPVPLSPAD